MGTGGPSTGVSNVQRQDGQTALQACRGTNLDAAGAGRGEWHKNFEAYIQL